MKDLIITALDNAHILLEKQVPQTKKKEEFVDIMDINPIDLITFMKDNNIPNDCYFSGSDNNGFGVAWQIDIPTTEFDKVLFKNKRFIDIAFKFVYDLLTTNGYKRVGFNSGLLKQFDDTTVYTMYKAKDFDRLVKYYSLPFVKV